MNRGETSTWISCLTPPGQSALATLGLYGPRAWEVLRKLFRRRSGDAQLPELPIAGRFWLGRLGDEVADEVVVAVKQTEPLPSLEVHGHGGREVVRFLVDLFREQDVQFCSWEDFLRRTNGDQLSVEAAIALTQATTLRTASILLDQQQGALSRALDAILHALECGESAMAVNGLAQLAQYAPLGQRLAHPWRVVVAGAPNVGKSSLVNALAGYQRSIVAATPGTTRDVVTTRLALDGWPIELADTAGMRNDAETLEEQGIDRARAMVADAELCLWLLDASAPPVWPREPLNAVLYVVNKVDLPPVWLIDDDNAMQVSARTGAGLSELCAAVIARLVPDPPPSGAAVTFTLRQSEIILSARRTLAAGNAEETRRLLMDLFVTPTTRE